MNELKLAIGPIDSNNDDLNQIYEMINSTPQIGPAMGHSECQEDPIFTIFSFNISGKRIKDYLSFPVITFHEKFMLASIIPENYSQIIQLIQQKFTELTKIKNTLDLSSLSTKGFPLAGIENMRNVKKQIFYNFIFFYCSLKCQQKNLTINTLHFEDNQFNIPFVFKKFNHLFPHLTDLYLQNNPLNPSEVQRFLSNKINVHFNGDSQNSNVLFCENDFDFTIKEPETPGLFTQMESRLTSFNDEPMPFNLHPSIIFPTYSINDFPPMQFVEEEFFLNRFFSEYFAFLWNLAIPEFSNPSYPPADINDFYDKDSVFSISVFSVCSHLTLENFEKYSSDIQKGQLNHLQGPEHIKNGLLTLFPMGFLAHPLAYSVKQCSEDIVNATFHGVFQLFNEPANFFDRSIVVKKDQSSSRWLISNDHIFIHMIRPHFLPPQ